MVGDGSIVERDDTNTMIMLGPSPDLLVFRGVYSKGRETLVTKHNRLTITGFSQQYATQIKISRNTVLLVDSIRHLDTPSDPGVWSETSPLDGTVW